MTVYYLDPEDGDNAQAGTSFATRKKTLNSIPSMLVADELRIIAARAPIAVGNALFTHGTSAVTGTFPVKTIDNCDAAWTASANVTATATVTTGERIEGTAASKQVVATAFVTGKAAYRTLPVELDLSAYDSVSFVMLASAVGIITGGYLVLCSDTTGDVPVETIRFNLSTGATVITAAVAGWYPVVYNKGSALPASIKSVAVYYDVDPGAATLTLDNIVATVKGGLTHDSLVGKMSVDEPHFWPLSWIREDAVGIGQVGAVNNSVSSCPYQGTTETVPAFIQPTQRMPNVSADRTLLGTTRCIVTGGWDRSDMATRTGKSYLAGGNASTTAIVRASTMQELSNFAFCSFITAAFSAGSPAVMNNIDLYGMTGTALFVTAPLSTERLNFWNFGYIVNCAMWTIAGDSALGSPTITVKAFIGYRSSTATNAFFTWNTLSQGWRLGPPPVLRIGKVAYSNAYALVLAGDCILNGTTFVGNTNDIRFTDAEVRLVNCTGVNNVLQSSSGQGYVSSDKKIWQFNSSGELQNTVENTVSAGAFKLSVTNAAIPNVAIPSLYKLAEVAVDGTRNITFRFAGRRTSLTLNAGVKVFGGFVKGVDVDVVTALAGAINTWAPYTLTVTPTGPGVVEVWGYGYGAIADAFVGDLAWS